jgi:hypothetical protein
MPQSSVFAFGEIRDGYPVPVLNERAVRAAAGIVLAPTQAQAERCKVPEFAKKLGHEQMWKLHDNCP